VFTGIIQEVGTVEALEVTADGARIRVRAPPSPTSCETAIRFSVNGVLPHGGDLGERGASRPT
jgi:riboflavin synthase alpha subunit